MFVMRAADHVSMSQLRLKHLAWTLLGVTAIIGAVGIDQVETNGPQILNLDAEKSIPAAWSGGLLALAALGALLVGRDEQPGRRRGWYVLAGLFAFLATDEVVSIHERLGKLTGVDWQYPYIPVLLFSLGLGIVVLLRLWRQRPFLAFLFALGAAIWAGAQVLELIQWDGTHKIPSYDTLMVPEEIGEMLGSCCFVFALFGWVLEPAAATAEARNAAPSRPLPSRS